MWKLPGFGLSRGNMGTLKTIVTVGTKNKAGELLYPDRYVITTKEALLCEPGFANGKSIFEIPFSQCKIIPRAEG